MPNVFAFVSVAAAAVAGLTGPDFVSRCVHPQRLTLKSAYSEKPLIDRARQITLAVTIDDRGNGTGVLTFDPNIRDAGASTDIALREVPVQVRLLDEHDGTGRRLYALAAVGGGERWVLVRPLKGGSPSVLMFADQDGKFRDAVLVE